MDDEILRIIPPALPFGYDEKVFYHHDEDGEYGEPYSMNDFHKQIANITGINTELLGK